jgi:uncharacterized membrane protein YeaQ/YmgE (transglycosylase-associated protein family)
MDIIYQAIFGLVVGIIAKLLMPGRDPGGCIITMILGIAGAALGGWVTRTYLPAYQNWHWISAICGALLLLIIYRIIFGSKTT